MGLTQHCRSMGIIPAIIWLAGTLFLATNLERDIKAERPTRIGEEVRIEMMVTKSRREKSSTINGSPMLKVPFPIFVASLPKSGTTSIARMFYCGNVSTAHTFANTQDGQQVRIGECYQKNVGLSRPPFEGCGNYDVWSDNGFIRGRRCYYPSIHGLSEYYKHYPNATILLVKRKITNNLAPCTGI